jgi:hypothetical protein
VNEVLQEVPYVPLADDAFAESQQTWADKTTLGS